MILIKNILIIALAVISFNCSSETWDLSVSRDKSLNVKILESDSFRINLGTRDVRIKHSFWTYSDRGCFLDYGKKHGAYSFNDTRIKLEFKCKDNRVDYKISTDKGVEFAFKFLMNNLRFKTQFTSPDKVFGENKISFKEKAFDLVNKPSGFKESHETSKGNWYGATEEPNQFNFFDNIKIPTSRLIEMKYNSRKDEMKMSVNLSEARWQDGGYSKPIAACSYSKFSGKSGTVYINNAPVEIPIKCQYYNSISYHSGSGIAMVSDVGYLIFDKKITLSSEILKQLKKAKKIDIRLDINGVQKNILSRKITLSRSLEELIEKLNEKRRTTNEAEMKKKSLIKQQIDTAM